MANFKQNDINSPNYQYPLNLQSLQQGPVLYQQPQVYQQNYGIYPPQQGIQYPYGINSIQYGNNLQNQGYPINQNPGVYLSQALPLQTGNVNLNFLPQAITTNICQQCQRPNIQQDFKPSQHSYYYQLFFGHYVGYHLSQMIVKIYISIVHNAVHQYIKNNLHFALELYRQLKLQRILINFIKNILDNFDQVK